MTVKKAYKKSNVPLSQRRKKRLSRSLAGDISFTLILSVLGIIMLIPLIYTVFNAFKPLGEFYVFPPRFTAQNPTFDNFRDLFTVVSNMWIPFFRYLFNSVFVSAVTLVAYIVICAFCAYPLAKHDFLGKSAVDKIIVTAIMFSSSVMAVPQYIMMSKVGLIDTYFALIIPVLGGSMGVFLMRQFMEEFPLSVIESARIDGAGEAGVLWKIVMPSQKPAWITVAIFTFQTIWGATAQNMIFTEEIKPLPLMITQIASSGIARAGVSAAAGLVLLIPNIIFFIVSQSNILETMASSGVKG